jgi:hypothetical protein
MMPGVYLLTIRNTSNNDEKFVDTATFTPITSGLIDKRLTVKTIIKLQKQGLL